MIHVVAALAGALFAIGLAIGGMTIPANVIGFLDLFGDFDPTLAFVMVGAIAVHAPVYWLVVRRRAAPRFGASFEGSEPRAIDRGLVVGAAVFGVGWGLVGYCPGPAIVALGAGGRVAAAFVVAMAIGMLAVRRATTP